MVTAISLRRQYHDPSKKVPVLCDLLQRPEPVRDVSDDRCSSLRTDQDMIVKESTPIARTLDRIRQRNKALRAFTHIAPDPDEHTEAALWTRPLRGLPIAVKDMIDTADMPTSYGSRIYDGHRPVMDAAIVTALRQAGAFVVGKTTTTEFATHPSTATINPRNVSHTPGGSSAGSAAAVAAGLVSIALGTQTLGSIIRPASYCGVVGFKPSHGWFPHAGIKSLATSLDTVGFLAADVATTRRVYTALVTEDAALTPKAKPRLLFTRQLHWQLASADAQLTINSCIAELREKGFSIVEFPMPSGFHAMTDAAEIIHDFEMFRALAPELSTGRDRMDPTLAARIDQAQRRTTNEYRGALKAIDTQQKSMEGLFESFDAIVCLSAPSEAPRGLSFTGSPAMNSAWTALHLPCLSLPIMASSAGLPIGLQIIAGKYQELRLLNIGAEIEAVMPDLADWNVVPAPRSCS